MKFKKLLIILLPMLLLTVFFFKDDLFFFPNHWETSIPEIGSASSPRAIDLNNDSIKDIVVGGGGEEFAATNCAVIALDGKDGSVLWKVKGRNQVIGSAVFKDITQDGIPDVFIGGRSAILYAINGASGNLIWEFLPDYKGIDPFNDSTILNFFTPQFIPDVNSDQVDDLLIAYGGFVKAKPEDVDRPTGSLMVINTMNGSILAQDTMPDGLETYMSPIIHDFECNKNLSIIFGSGGETISGHLYKVSLQDLLNNDLSNATVLDSGKGKGFIAPPALADVNQDGIQDIIANAVNGRMVCIDGSSNKILWEATLGSGYEVYTTPAPGNFLGNDSTPNFFANFGYGIWPDTEFAVSILVDGKNGEIVMKDMLGTFQYASPVIFDFTRDGREDVLVAINLRTTSGFAANTTMTYHNQMKVYDLKDNVVFPFDKEKIGSNLGSTPLLTDLDEDGRLDLIYCYMRDSANFYSFKELRIERVETNIKITSPIQWGGYMGTDYSGVYRSSTH